MSTPTIEFTPIGSTLTNSRVKILWEDEGSPSTFYATIGTPSQPINAVGGGLFDLINGNAVEVTFDASVTTLNYRAFYNNNSLTKVIFSNSCNIGTIGDDAFKQCTSLSEINLNALTKLTSIGQFAFRDTGLTNITLPDSQSLYTLGYGAFYGTSSLSKVTFGTNIASIGHNVFRDSGLTYNGGTDFLNLDFPTLSEIGQSVFSSANITIKKVALPTNANSNYTRIDGGLFSGCSLTEITIPTSVVEIQSNAFFSCNFTEVTIPASCYNIHTDAFRYASIKDSGSSVTIKNLGFTPSLRSQIFGSATITVDVTPVSGTSNTYSLYTADPSKFTSTDAYQIRDANSISQIPNFVLHDDVTEIGHGAFAKYGDTMNMKLLILGANTTIIGEDAFSNQTELETILIKNQLVSIGQRAFKDCFKFKGGSHTAAGTNTNFTQNHSASVKNLLPYHSDYKTIGLWTFFHNYMLHMSTYGEGELYDYTQDQYYTDTTETPQVIYPIMPLKIPTQVTEIGRGAFEYNSGFTGDPLLNTRFKYLIFTHYDSNSNSYNDIKIHFDGNSVNLGSAYVNNISLKKIGMFAFKDRNYLKHMLVGPNLNDIDGGAFSGCSNLQTFAYTSPSNGVIQINQVTNDLGANAFTGSNAMTTVRFFGRGSAFDNLESAFPDTTINKIEATFVHEANHSAGRNLNSGNITFDISFQTGVTSIANDAYKDESKLTKVVFPAEIVSIGQQAFHGCNALTEIDFSSSAASANGPGVTDPVPFLGTGAFTGSTLGATAFNYTFHNDFNEAYKNTTYFSGGLATTINVDGVTPGVLVATDIQPNLVANFFNTINISENVEVLSFNSSAAFNVNGNQHLIEKINFPLSITGVSEYAFASVQVQTPSDYLRIAGPATNPVGNQSFYNTNVVKVVDLSGCTNSAIASFGLETFKGKGNPIHLINNIDVYLPKFNSPQNFDTNNKYTFRFNSGIIYLHPEDNNAHTFITAAATTPYYYTNIIGGVVINSPSQMTNDSYILKYILRDIPTANPFSYVVNNYRIPSNVGAIIELGSWVNNTSNDNVTFEYIHTVPITSSLTSDELYNAVTVDSSKYLYLRFSSIKLYPGYKLYLYGGDSAVEASGHSSISVSNNETTIEFKPQAYLNSLILKSQMFDNTNGVSIGKNEIGQQMYLSENIGIRSPPTYTILLFFQNKLVYRNSV